jgi:hypothetical protein
MKKLALTIILAYSVTAGSAEQQPASRFQQVVARMVEAINEQDYAAIGKDFDQTMEDFFGLDKREPFFKSLFAQYGKIKELDEPRITQPDRRETKRSCHCLSKADGWLSGVATPKSSISIMMFQVRGLPSIFSALMNKAKHAGARPR